MLVYDEDSWGQSRRILMRTEKSIEKVIVNYPNTHLNKMKKYIRMDLKGQLFRDKIDPQNKTKLVLGKTEQRSPKRVTKAKSKSIRNLFKNAHSASKDESFLVPKRQKFSFNRTCLRHNLHSQTKSEKKLAQQLRIEQVFSIQNGTPQQDDEKNKEYKTIACESRNKRYRRKISLTKPGSSSPVQYQFSSKKDRPKEELQSYPLQISSKVRAFSHQKTVPKAELKNDMTIMLNTLEREETLSQHQPLQTLLTIQKSRLYKVGTPIQDRTCQVSPKTIVKTFTNPAQLEKETISKQFGDCTSNRKNVLGKKSNLYEQAENNDFLDIDEIKFQESYNRNSKNEASSENKTRVGDVGKDRASVNLTRCDQPNSKIQRESFQSIDKKQHFWKKNSKKIKSCKTMKSPPSLDKDQVDVDFQEDPFFKQESKDHPQQKHTESQIIQQNLIERQRTPSISAKDKDQVTSIMKKLSLFKNKMQLLGELATFFSKKSKTFKLNTVSQEFFRNKQDLRWHKLVYLNFKYFFATLLLCEQFYFYASKIVSIRPEDLHRFSEENQLLRGTLAKIEKSVRKNMGLSSQDQVWLTDQLPTFAGSDLLVLVKEVIGERGGSSISYVFFNNLYQLIVQESAILIKSIFLSKVLNSQASTACALKEAVFRILNTSTILFLHQSRPKSQKSWEAMPITDVAQLSNPETEMFRTFYNAVVSNIFTAN